VKVISPAILKEAEELVMWDFKRSEVTARLRLKFRISEEDANEAITQSQQSIIKEILG
jgi:hypothetical protein